MTSSFREYFVSHYEDAKAYMNGNIFEAVARRDVEGVKEILAADPTLLNSRDDTMGMIPICIAASASDLAMVQLLASYSHLDVTLKDYLGLDALDHAISAGHPEIKRILLELRVEQLGLSEEEATTLPRLVPKPPEL